MVWRLRRRDRNREAREENRPALDAHVDEGLLIAATALRLGAKNRLIVNALRDGQPFDQEWWEQTVREDIEALIQERETDAARLQGVRASARRRLGRPQHFHDYRHADVAILALREQVDRELAKRLRELLGDSDFCRSILASARESALDEIVSAHAFRQTQLAGFVRDERYVAEREERIESVRHDLEALARARSW